MRLFGYFRSSTSYRLRIALGLKGLAFENVPVSLVTGENKQPGFTSRNPFGSLPMLEADGRDRAQSMALLADSLDMFADAAVYLLALFAVGKGLQLQLRAAKVAGWLQAILALGVLAEVVRRALYGSEPQSTLMLGMASLALVANVSCLVLLARHRQGGVHMKASWIFSANDVLINFGVILGALLVAWTGSAYPDLLVGAVVGAIVLLGAKRILALRR